MIVYLDASVVLRILLRQPKRLAAWGRWEAAYSSELLGIESRRVIDRLRVQAALNDHELADVHHDLTRIERAIGAIPLTRPVLHRAALPMPTAVKTLDAIHLASALLLREHRTTSLTFATHDPQQLRAARALGFECLGA
jgi:predicted nucleic acid-binding protein